MKKLLIILIIIITLTSQSQAPKPQKIRMVTITLTENTWLVLFDAMDRSQVQHTTIRALQDSLYPQFNDTIKNPIRR